MVHICYEGWRVLCVEVKEAFLCVEEALFWSVEEVFCLPLDGEGERRPPRCAERERCGQRRYCGCAAVFRQSCVFLVG